MKPDPTANQGRGPLPKRAGFRDFVIALVYALCAGLLLYITWKASK